MLNQYIISTMRKSIEISNFAFKKAGPSQRNYCNITGGIMQWIFHAFGNKIERIVNRYSLFVNEAAYRLLFIFGRSARRCADKLQSQFQILSQIQCLP